MAIILKRFPIRSNFYRLALTLALLFSTVILRAEPASPSAPPKIILNLSYSKDGKKQTQLDLYLPAVVADGKSAGRPALTPLLMFVHGGAWVSGDKGQYRDGALTLANAGIAVACINYRLSSNSDRAVQHPTHVNDVAAAYHWLRSNDAVYHFDTKQIFLAGHSAGAHIVALLALDARYLKNVGENPRDLAGVIALSGIYDIPELINRWPRYQDEFIAAAFGKNKNKWMEASPITHVRDTPVPWLIIHSPDDELVDLNQSQEFVDKLNAAEDKVSFMNHFYKSHFDTVMSISKPDDPITRRIIDFITGPVR